MKKIGYIVVAIIIIFLIYNYGFKLKDENNLNVIASVAGACETSEANWLEKESECENTTKTWCEVNQGQFSECESACRHDHDPLTICTAQCIGVCSFDKIYEGEIDMSHEVRVFKTCEGEEFWINGDSIAYSELKTSYGANQKFVKISGKLTNEKVGEFGINYKKGINVNKLIESFEETKCKIIN